MSDEDPNNDLVNVILSSVTETALDSDPSPDEDSPRDAWWLRWLKYISIITVPAIILGLGFLFASYFGQHQAGSYSQRAEARQQVEQDTISSMKWRFGIGAGLGGGLGLIYVARCIIRKVDP